MEIVDKSNWFSFQLRSSRINNFAFPVIIRLSRVENSFAGDDITWIILSHQTFSFTFFDTIDALWCSDHNPIRFPLNELAEH